MTKKTLNENIIEQLESSATEADLVDDADQFTMNEVEKTDVEHLEQPVDPKYQVKPKVEKTTTKETVVSKVKEQLESSATEDDLVDDADQFKMNEVEKSDVDHLQEPVDPAYQKMQQKK